MFDELLASVARALDSHNIPYMIIGGQAVLLHGEPRLTRDIDVTLAADLDRLPTVVAAAEAAGLEPLVDPDEFTKRTMVLPCRDPESAIRVDFILSFSPYERDAIARAKGVALGGVSVRFATAEDLVIHKILAGRPRDLEDVRAVLLKNPGIDHGLVRGVLSEFDDALARSAELRGRFDVLWKQTRPSE